VTQIETLERALYFEADLATEAGTGIPVAHLSPKGPAKHRLLDGGQIVCVEAELDILNRELVTIMRQAGAPTLADITGVSVVRPAA
jgi:hypothetical protein